MIVTIKKEYDGKQMENLLEWIKTLGLSAHVSKGDNCTIVGLIGDTSKVDIDLLRSLDMVESVNRSRMRTANSTPKTRSWTSKDTKSAADTLPSWQDRVRWKRTNKCFPSQKT